MFGEGGVEQPIENLWGLCGVWFGVLTEDARDIWK
jgi:hypothetical protein